MIIAFFVDIILLVLGYIISRFTLIQGSPGKISNFEVLWSPLRFPRYLWIIAFLISIIPVVNKIAAVVYFIFNLILLGFHFHKESNTKLLNRIYDNHWSCCIISRWNWKDKLKYKLKDKLKPIINFLKEDL